MNENQLAAWRLFPYPTAHLDNDSGKVLRFGGSLVPMQPVCKACPDRPCERIKSKDIQICKYGISFLWLGDAVLVLSVVVADLPSTTQAARKRLKSLPAARVKKADLFRAAASVSGVDTRVLLEFDAYREEVVTKFVSSGEAFASIVTEIRDSLTHAVNQSHDLEQFIRQVQGHIKTIMARKYPNDLPEVAADLMEAEGAIFFAAELMLGKIDATLFLTEPNRVFGGESTFELHRFITKYFLIYKNRALEKGVDLRRSGETYGRIRYNSTAVGVVIHALLDNTVKYAPAGSKADIVFAETSSSVNVKFESVGPRIDPDESDKIFMPGIRGKAAEEIQRSGLGFGLAAAKQISDLLDLRLAVTQMSTPESGSQIYYKTTFSLVFEKVLPTALR
jgi:signal transduction histidine kinase